MGCPDSRKYLACKTLIHMLWMVGNRLLRYRAKGFPDPPTILWLNRNTILVGGNSRISNFLWKLPAAPKDKLFCWQLILERLPTNVRHKLIFSYSDDICCRFDLVNQRASDNSFLSVDTRKKSECSLDATRMANFGLDSGQGWGWLSPNSGLVYQSLFGL